MNTKTKIEQSQATHVIGTTLKWIAYAVIGVWIAGLLVIGGVKAWEWMNKDTITIRVIGR